MIFKPACGNPEAHEAHEALNRYSGSVTCQGQSEECAAASALFEAAMRLSYLRLHDPELVFRAECGPDVLNGLYKIIMTETSWPTTAPDSVSGISLKVIPDMPRSGWRIVAASSGTPGDREEH